MSTKQRVRRERAPWLSLENESRRSEQNLSGFERKARLTVILGLIGYLQRGL